MSYSTPRYAEISAYDANDTITIAASGIANKVQITSFDTNGPSSDGMTPDHTNDHITILVPGDYAVKVCLSAESVAGSGAEFGFGMWVNNGGTQKTNIHAHRNLTGGGGDTGSVAMCGLVTFAKNDTAEIWVWNEDNTQNIIIDDINLTIAKRM